MSFIITDFFAVIGDVTKNIQIHPCIQAPLYLDKSLIGGMIIALVS